MIKRFVLEVCDADDGCYASLYEDYSGKWCEYKDCEKEVKALKEELKRIQRLPHMDKARASAVIMQVAAQLAKMPEHKKARQLKDAVDRWATYTSRVEAERDKLLSLLQMSANTLQECLQHVDWSETKADVIREALQQIDEALK